MRDYCQQLQVEQNRTGQPEPVIRAFINAYVAGYRDGTANEGRGKEEADPVERWEVAASLGRLFDGPTYFADFSETGRCGVQVTEQGTVVLLVTGDLPDWH